MQDLLIKHLTPGDAEQLSQVLNDDVGAYGQYFTPFPTDPENLKERLDAAVRDRYWGLWFGKALAGFFMLRGFDERYSRPSFGVYIAHSFSQRGLSKLALDFCISWCRLNNIPTIMLKVHPDNSFARHTYEQAGFRFLEVCPRTGHNVMEKDLGAR